MTNFMRELIQKHLLTTLTSILTKKMSLMMTMTKMMMIIASVHLLGNDVEAALDLVFLAQSAAEHLPMTKRKTNILLVTTNLEVKDMGVEEEAGVSL